MKPKHILIPVIVLMACVAAVRCSAWLGVLRGAWCVIFIAWCVVLVLWVRALVAYLNAYREYQERHGKPYQSPCESNKFNRVLLHNLRRLGLVIRNPNLKSRARKLVNLTGEGIVRESVNENLNVLCAGGQEPLSLFRRIRSKFCNFVRCHNTPNDPSSATRRTGRNDC
jgi:hypothetical protein